MKYETETSFFARSVLRACGSYEDYPTKCPTAFVRNARADLRDELESASEGTRLRLPRGCVIKAIEFLETDSGNMNHAAAYYRVTWDLPEDLVKTLADNEMHRM